MARKPLVIPRNLSPKGIRKGGLGIMNRDGQMVGVDWNGVEVALGGSADISAETAARIAGDTAESILEQLQGTAQVPTKIGAEFLPLTVSMGSAFASIETPSDIDQFNIVFETSFSFLANLNIGNIEQIYMSGGGLASSSAMRDELLPGAKQYLIPLIEAGYYQGFNQIFVPAPVEILKQAQVLISLGFLPPTMEGGPFALELYPNVEFYNFNAFYGAIPLALKIDNCRMDLNLLDQPVQSISAKNTVFTQIHIVGIANHEAINSMFAEMAPGTGPIFLYQIDSVTLALIDTAVATAKGYNVIIG